MAVSAVPAHRPKDLDLLIRCPNNGSIFIGSTDDPVPSLNASNFDIGIADGVIKELRAAIPEERASKVVVLPAGAIVTPGLVDIHTHLYELHSTWGINGDKHCLAHGTTLAADAGTAGEVNFFGLLDVLSRLQLDTRAYMNLCSIGLVGKHGEFLNRDVINLIKLKEAVERVQELNPAMIAGLKVRTGRLQVGVSGIDVLEKALEGAHSVGLPLMVHVADQPDDIPLDEVAKRLRYGDIITHCFQGKGISKGDAILNEKGEVRDVVLEAMRRGIRFDVGHGMGSFSWDVAEKALGNGFRPTSISSDIHKLNVGGPVYDFPTVLSKFLFLGLPLGEVLALSTIAPARELKYPHGIQIGLPANISVFRLEEGPVTFKDSGGHARQGKQILKCEGVIVKGNFYEPAAGVSNKN